MKRFGLYFLTLGVASTLAACSSTPIEPPNAPVAVSKRAPTGRVAAVKQHPEWEAAPQGSGYYLDDGPGSHRPVDLHETPDPVPILEPIARANTRTYTVMEQTFHPQQSLEEPYRMEGRASWYGRKFHGAKTANGEIYDMYQMTAAHPTLPLPSYARVTNLGNNKSVIVRVNDRGPFLRGRIIDLSYAAALKLDYINQGSAHVLVEKFTPDMIMAMQGDAKIADTGARASQPATQVLAVSRVPGSAGLGGDRPVTDSELSAPVDPAQLIGDAQPVVEAAAVAIQSAPVIAEAAPTAVSVAPTQVIPPNAQAGQVYLQLGAFGRKGNASAVQDDIVGRFPDVREILKIHESAGLFRVMVGPYATFEAAQQAALQLSADGKYTPVIKEGLILP